MPAKSYNRIPLPVKVIFWAVIALFAIFLILPMLLLLAQSINDDGT